MPEITRQIIHSDDDITYQAGSSDQAVVSFTGIGFGMHGIQIEEFRKTLSQDTNHVYYVIDRSRHWYNSSFDKIADTLNGDFAKNGVKRVVTLGNSMGGFGAVIFATVLHGCQRSIAFSAQSAIDPAIVPWDRRFKKLTDSVQRWTGLDAMNALRSDHYYFLFFGSTDPIDVRHAARFASADCATMSICLVDGTGHAVAADLKKRGILSKLMVALIDGDGPCIDMRNLFGAVPHQMQLKPVNCS